MTEGDGESAPRNVSNYWDTLAPHHWRIEDNYLDVSSLRRILGDIREPVLIIGAGQGLIVEELRRQGLRCDGIDLSARMLAIWCGCRDVTRYTPHAVMGAMSLELDPAPSACGFWGLVENESHSGGHGLLVPITEESCSAVAAQFSPSS